MPAACYLINTDDVLLSFLPLSHSFERMAGYYLPVLFGGATILRTHRVPMRDLIEVRPTLMTGVPRVFETYSQIRLQVLCRIRYVATSSIMRSQWVVE